MPTTLAGCGPATHDELTLFAFDDFSLPFQQNLALHMLQPRKHPRNPIMKRSPGGPDSLAIEYGTVLQQEGRFRYWYTAWSDTPGARPLTLGYAESDDGIQWERPKIGLAEWQGNTENNVLPIEPLDSPYVRDVVFPCVLYEPDDPNPERRYKMTFIAIVPREALRDTNAPWTRCPTLMAAVSPDGFRWRLASDDLPIQDMFEVGSLHRFQGWYYATGQQVYPWVWLPGGRETGRIMVAFRSRDFERWSSARALCFQRAMQKSTPQGQGEEVHVGAGIWNRGNVLIGLYGQWHGEPEPFGPDVVVDLGFIVSNDGVHFREPEVDFKAIPRGGWDVGFICQTNGFAQIGDETWVWYTGALERGNVPCPVELGLATWRRDGFGCLALKDRWEDGHLLTCPIGLNERPGRVYLNVDGLGDGAWVRVEALDEDDRPLPGYAAGDAIPITESGLHQAARWQGGDAMTTPDDRPVTLKVTLHGAGRRQPRLYAVYVAQA